MDMSLPARVQRPEYYYRRQKIQKEFGQEFDALITAWYGTEKMSAYEIVDRLMEKGIVISARSINRAVKALGLARSTGDAFRNAATRGRVHWAYKDPSLKIKRKRLPNRTRFEIMRRDGFKCVLCGAGPGDGPLEIDHIVPLVRGGADTSHNLRVLCYSCNVGKRIVDNER